MSSPVRGGRSLRNGSLPPPSQISYAPEGAVLGWRRDPTAYAVGYTLPPASGLAKPYLHAIRVRSLFCRTGSRRLLRRACGLSGARGAARQAAKTPPSPACEDALRLGQSVREPTCLCGLRTGHRQRKGVRSLFCPSYKAVGADCRRPLASPPPAPAGHGSRASGQVGVLFGLVMERSTTPTEAYPDGIAHFS